MPDTLDKQLRRRYVGVMRKIYFLLAVAIIAVIGAFVVFQHRRSRVRAVEPEVLNVGSSQVTVAWLSKESYKGRVFYQPAGSGAAPSSVGESFGASDRHEVVIAGLRPSTRYTYWIAGSETRFQFQTQPLPNKPFSFMVVWGDISDRIVRLMMAETPEFLICLTAAPEGEPDCFSDVRPYVPVYGPRGVDSVFLRSTADKQTADPGGAWGLDWGGLRLVFANETAAMKELLKAPAAHTVGIITSADAVEPFKSAKGIDKERLVQTSTHSALIRHNEQNPARAAAFVGVVGERDETVEVGGVHYFGIPVERHDTGAIRIDVDVESATAFFIDEDREVVLKEPPLKQERTCEQCRRLADKGAYAESVRAYEEFIETHQGHYQIDDAYFAIAEILDEKLFRFPQALLWYRRLVDEYPDGTLNPLARQRIKYLSAYSDHDYKPLARFERIRKIELARKKRNLEDYNRLLEQVETLIGEYPDSALAPVMQYWLGNQWRQSQPDRAVKAYVALREKYPDHPEAREVLIDIGQTYYELGRYDKAMEVYADALSELPSLADTIKAQIARCKRNIRRVRITLICWLVLAVTSALGILLRPIGIDTDKILLCLAAFVLLGTLLSFGAWLIYEQFSYIGQMLLLVFLLSAAAAISSLISLSLAEKVFARHTGRTAAGRSVSAVIAGSIMGVVLLAASIYLVIYYTNVHYLIVVGM
ncbi:MAG: tetratricopeptide repeat protein [Planctomycetota bacterium]